MKPGVTVCNDTLDTLREGRAASELSENLVFYEVSGQAVSERGITPPLADLNRLVEKKILKSIERSSGGFTQAVAVRVFAEESLGKEPAIRLRMKFTDFLRDAKGKVEKDEYVVQYKSLFPDEIRNAEAIQLGGNVVQRFLLDFGDGAVPVQVVHTAPDEKGELMAYFIELMDLDNVRNGKKETQIWVRVYCCRASVIRFLPEQWRHSASTFQKALANYSRLRKEGKRIVPQCFEGGPAFRVPAGLSISDLRTYLEVLIKRQKNAPVSETTQGDEKANPFEISEDDLIPFGTYE